MEPGAGPSRPPGRFPRWGGLVLPAAALWGTVIGLALGVYFGNPAIGAAIGAGLGVGIGLALLAAAIVIASSRL
jgi:hypothetical protein